MHLNAEHGGGAVVLSDWLKRLKIIRSKEGWHDAETVVVSFPKSGRTWHRLMLGAYLIKLCDLPFDQALKLGRVCTRLGIPKPEYIHNGSGIVTQAHYSSPVLADTTGWQGKRILLLVRDPRDVLISAYQHAKFRDEVFTGDLSEYIRSPIFGIDKVLTALNRWHAGRDRAVAFEVVSYEAMHRDGAGELRRTVRFLGLEPQEDLLQAAVEMTTFDRMKQYERDNVLNSTKMTHTQDERGSKVREGKIGGYRAHLSKADIEYIDARILALGNPFADYSR